MAFYNCETERKSDIYKDCTDNGFEITKVYPLDGYDQVRHLVAFIIGSNIFNVCNSYDHGGALNALTERFGRDNALIILLEKNHSWRICGNTNSLSTLKSLKKFLISIHHRFDEYSSIQIDEINPNIKSKQYKQVEFNSLIEQVNDAIIDKEEEIREIAEKEVIEEIVHQLEARRNKTLAQKVKGYLCGR